MAIKEFPIDREKVRKACMAVIDALDPYPVEIKVVALHNLIQTLPKEYQIVEIERIDKHSRDIGGKDACD